MAILRESVDHVCRVECDACDLRSVQSSLFGVCSDLRSVSAPATWRVSMEVKALRYSTIEKVHRNTVTNGDTVWKRVTQMMLRFTNELTIVYRAGLKTARRILARVQVTSIILVRLPRVAHVRHPQRATYIACSRVTLLDLLFSITVIHPFSLHLLKGGKAALEVAILTCKALDFRAQLFQLVLNINAANFERAAYRYFIG